MSISSSYGTGSARSYPSSLSSIGSINGFRQSKFEKDVNVALRNGVSDCKNMRHWRTVIVPNTSGTDKVWTSVELKEPREILRMMSAGKARCSCERNACRWAWKKGNWNHKGMYHTEWVLEGREEKGISCRNDGRYAAKKVFPLHHSVPESKFNVLIESFPEIHFVGSYGPSHDHPVAHYRTKIASERLLDMLPKGTVDAPKRYIDLNGNPQANKAYMKRVPGIHIDTLVEAITPKDFIRKATKWGPKYNEDGSSNYEDDIHIRDIPTHMAGMGDDVDGFISIHTTYYYDATEIANLLSWAPNAVWYASMHRFDGMEGYLNDKEQHWEKIEGSFGYRVIQQNVKTRETYEHQDNAWWFEHNSRICGDTAFGWTMNELCPETFVFIATTCPVSQARMSYRCLVDEVPTVELKQPTKPQTKDQMRSSRRMEVSVYGVRSVETINIHHVDLFDDLRAHLIGKSRGAKEYKDHVSRARVMAKGVMSDQKIAVESQALENIIRYSFMIDFEHSYASDSSMFSTTFVTALKSDHLYKEGTGFVAAGTLSLLTDILMTTVDSRNLKMAAVGALRGAVNHARKRKVIGIV